LDRGGHDICGERWPGGHLVLTKPDFSKATSLHDLGIKLLQSIGYASPSDADVALALDAHRTFTEQIEAIAERAQAGLQQ
jgi:hypothetical protein